MTDATNQIPMFTTAFVLAVSPPLYRVEGRLKVTRYARGVAVSIPVGNPIELPANAVFHATGRRIRERPSPRTSCREQ